MRVRQQVSISTFSVDIANDTLLANIIMLLLPLNDAITILLSLLGRDISLPLVCVNSPELLN